MATVIIPSEAQLSDAAEYRNFMYFNAMTRLQHLAYRALYVHNIKNDEFVMICIQVDSPWRDVVDHLMPNYDWQEERDKGIDPVARGSVFWSFIENIVERLPDIADVLMEKPCEGKVKVIVLSEGGGTVYELEPKPEQCN